jgi:hypothetical protein
MAKKTGLMKRRGSSALAKSKSEVSKYRSKLSAMRRDAKQSATPEALMKAGCVLGGAAAAGAVQVYMPTLDPSGAIPSPVIMGLILMGAGAAMGGTWGPAMICASSGMLSGYVQAQVTNTMAAQAIPTA